jgi:signal transduction histidine kinase
MSDERLSQRLAGSARALWRRLVAGWERLTSPPPAIEPLPFTLLRRRLIRTNLLAAAVALLVVSIAVYQFEARLELSQIDSQLAREASGPIKAGLPDASTPERVETPYDPSSANYFSIIVSSSGQVVQDDDQAQRLNLPDMAALRPVLSGAQDATYATIQRGDIMLRLYSAPIVEQGRIVGAVQSGMSLGSYNQQLYDLSRALVALDLFMGLLILGSSVYLTERAMKPARDAFERQRQFAAGASHELRTPLALIRSLAELVSDHRCAPEAAATASVAAASARMAADGEPAMTDASQNGQNGQGRADDQALVESQDSVADDAREIIHEVDYMTRLVTDLLLLARDEHDRRALNWVTADIRPIIQGVVSKMQTLATAQGVALKSELDGKADGLATLVEGDPDRLRELALILIENAIRYTPRGGLVTVAVKSTRSAVIRGERHGHVFLTVRDTGVGIAPEDQPHIFEPFYRASSSKMRRASPSGVAGSGLGLALAHWIAEAHGGQISLVSAPGVGTTFTVELPLVPQARPSHPVSREPGVAPRA